MPTALSVIGAVRAVYDGIEAIKLAGEFHPDIVLLDLGMPGIDGYETARRLRDLKKGQHFRIIAVSGWGQESDRQKTREADIDLHLVKPVDADELLKALNNGDSTARTLHYRRKCDTGGGAAKLIEPIRTSP